MENSEKPRFIWIDAAANFKDFANSKENIARDLTLAKNAGFTDIVVDIRPTTGDILYKSSVSGVQQVEWLGAWFRQCQLELMNEVPNVGMVTTTDAGSEKFIHPPYKIKVGERLAYWALAKTYGIKGISYSGPIYKSCRMNGKLLEITFDYGTDGMGGFGISVFPFCNGRSFPFFCWKKNRKRRETTSFGMGCC